MEDQVITPKYKFDQMEKQLQIFKAKDYEVLNKQADNTLNVNLEIKYNDNYTHFRGYTNTKLLRLTFEKGKEFPKEIIEKIEHIREQIDKSTVDLIDREVKVANAQKILNDKFYKIETLPKWVLWMAGIKPVKDDTRKN